MIHWDKAPYSRNWMIDVPNVGRYLIKRLGKGSRLFRAYLNNKPTSFIGTEPQVKKQVERFLTSSKIGDENATS